MRFFESILALDSEWKSSEYVTVQRWMRKLRRRGSVSTLRAYFKFLAWFVQYIGMSPDDFVKMSKEDVSKKVQAFCDKFSDEDKKSSASNAMKALKSFLKANGFDVEKLSLKGSYRAMKRPEYVPSKEMIYKMASVCGLKWRAIILCLFQSGLRNSALRALPYSMLKDQIESGAVPIRVHITGELRRVLPDACKEGVDYWTFFGKEASEALRQYIDWRREKYGKVDNEELLFPSESRELPKGDRLRRPMDQYHLTKIVRVSAKKAGIKEWRKVRAHSLRKTFRSILDAGYLDGGQMAEDDKEYLMGHKLPGAKEPYHNANVNVLEECYMKLRWSIEEAMTEAAKVEALKAFARTLGVEDIEIKIARLKEAEKGLSDEEAIGRILRKDLGLIKLGAEAVQERKDNSDPKMIIDEERLEEYLAEGWDVQTVLPSGRILIRK